MALRAYKSTLTLALKEGKLMFAYRPSLLKLGNSKCVYNTRLTRGSINMVVRHHEAVMISYKIKMAIVTRKKCVCLKVI